MVLDYKGSKPETCNQCGGYGKLELNRVFHNRKNLSKMGAAKLLATCTKQRARRINKNKKLSVNVPSGVDNGTRIGLVEKEKLGKEAQIQVTL